MDLLEATIPVYDTRVACFAFAILNFSSGGGPVRPSTSRTGKKKNSREKIIRALVARTQTDSQSMQARLSSSLLVVLPALCLVGNRNNSKSSNSSSSNKAAAITTTRQHGVYDVYLDNELFLGIPAAARR
jgi:hypothetical protein